ncbi:MAG: LysM peptidoglycan-binding domain-containing M23 family metallopeptidase [Nitrospirota bacterium]|nr:M23 family metallopeptidase [Nitrospirota bacterium]
MNYFTQKVLPAVLRWKIMAASLIIIVGTFLLGAHVNQWIIQSRTVTQTQITEGWKASGIEMAMHTIQQKENFWKVARKYGVDIDTIFGANPDVEELHAVLGQKLRIPNHKGVIHRTEERDTVQTISSLYSIPVPSIIAVNQLRPKHILMPGLDLFIPGAKPVRLSEEMALQYSLRGIFGSPLPGRITSGMGFRTHPVGGFRGKHTGIDLAAAPGTNITAAAAGSVLQTGEGEYIGKFVILAHRDSYTTLYGHCSQILTTPGKTVKKGQLIAKVGNSGRTTGPHLHFEIRKNAVPQDPLKYLW